MNQEAFHALNREYQQLMGMGRYEEALGRIESLMAQCGKSPALMMDLMACCKKLRLHEKLNHSLAELQRQFFCHGAQLDRLGEELQKIGLFPEALATFIMMRQCSSAPERAVGAAREAALHLRLSALDAAEEALLRAEAAGQQFPEVRSARAMWLMRTSPAQALPILDELAQPKPQIPSEFTAAHGHHLAHVLDQLGQYEQAFTALLRAKEIERTSHPMVRVFASQRAAWRQWHADAGSFSKQQAQQWADETEAWSDHAFLLGHPRSGTTLLEQVLDAHEGLSSLEETNCYAMCVDARLVAEHERSLTAVPFADFVRNYTPAALAHLRQDYFQKLRSEKVHPVGTRVYLDKNPGLSISAARLAKTMPHSALLYAVRDPRDVCVSAFFQWCDRTPWSSHWLTMQDTVEQCAFTHHLWQQTKQQLVQPWMEIRYEDVVTDLVTWGKKATEFLGLSWQAQQQDHQQQAQSKLVKSPTHIAVQQKLYTHAMQRWKHYERWLQPHIKQLAPMIDHYGYDA